MTSLSTIKCYRDSADIRRFNDCCKRTSERLITELTCGGGGGVVRGARGGGERAIRGALLRWDFDSEVLWRRRAHIIWGRPSTGQWPSLARRCSAAARKSIASDRKLLLRGMERREEKERARTGAGQ